jgi:hypothetical protein
MRKIAIFLSLCSLILMVSVPAAAQTDNRSLIWERWDVQIDEIDLNANTFRVRETQMIVFDGRFRGGELALDTTRVTGIRDVQMTQAGRALSLTTCSSYDDFPPAGSFCVLKGYNETLISYEFFAPIFSSTETLTFEYTVAGALRVYEDGDQLWWTAVNDDRPGIVESSSITVSMPAGFAPREGIDPIGTYGAPGEIGVQGNVVTAVTTDAVRIGEVFSLRVQYPHNPNTPKPAWQTAFDTQQARLERIEAEAARRAAERAQFEATVLPWINIGIIAFGVLFGLGGVLIILVAYLQVGRKPTTGPVPEILTEPPVGVPPAVAGTIIDGITHVRDLLGTLIDLGRRGYLVIEESKNSATQVTEFTFKRTEKAPDDLDAYEKRFIGAVFPTSDGERKLNNMREAFYAQIPTLQAALRQWLIDQGLINAAALGLRARWAGWARMVALLGIMALFVGGWADNGVEDYILNAIRVAGIVALLNGGALFIFSRLVSDMPLTRKGAEAAAKSNAFYEYMENLDKFEQGDKTPEQFETYLPYAIAFGFENAWIGRFRHVADQPMPTWYYPVYRGGMFSGGYRRGQPHPSLSRESGGQPAGVPPPLGGLGGDKPAPDSGGFSLEGMSQGLSGGLNEISSGLTGMLNSASSAFVSRPAPPPPSSWSAGSGGFSDSGSGFDWGGTRSRSSGYRSTNSGGGRSGGWSSSRSRSFSGGGSRGGSSGGGRSRFR